MSCHDGALRNVERSDCDGDAADKHEVEQVGSDDVAQREGSMSFRERGDRGHKLRQRGAERDEGQRDHGFRYAECLRDQGAVVDEQPCADGDQDGSDDEKYNVFAHAVFLLRGFGAGIIISGASVFGGGFRCRSGSRMLSLHLQYRVDHIDDEEPEQKEACRAAEMPARVGGKRIEGGCREEEQNRGDQCLSVDVSGTYCDRQRRDQGRVADDGTDRVAVSDLAVTGKSGRRGDHDLGERGADGDDCRPDQQLRNMKVVRDSGRAVHKPVAAFNQKQQTNDKQKYGNQHKQNLLKTRQTYFTCSSRTNGICAAHEKVYHCNAFFSMKERRNIILKKMINRKGFLIYTMYQWRKGKRTGRL